MICFRPIELCYFWTMPWSAPFRAACPWVVLLGAPLQGHMADTHAPGWLHDHPEATAERFGGDAAPCWLADGWFGHERRWLRAQSDDGLLRLVAVEAERLVRIAQEAPTLVGSADWTGAALGAFARIAQVYAELKRRHHALPARAMLRAELRRFVEWTSNPNAAENDKPAACESAQETDVVLAER